MEPNITFWSRNVSRIRLALMASACLMLAQCDHQASAPTPVAVEAPKVPPVPTVAAPAPLITRADLLDAAARARSTYAAGATAGTEMLVGRAFALRVPFGCGGAPTTASPQVLQDGQAGWSWGPDRKTIELALRPGDWVKSALIADEGAAPVWEVVEGFWIPHPWLRSETCPTERGDEAEPAQGEPSPQSLGIAGTSDLGGSRVGRRKGRAYVHTIRGKTDALPVPPADGYRLLLEGRLIAFPDGQAIRCHAEGTQQRPVCIVAARLDKVAFEDSSGATLSEWRPG